ncbi:MAG: hypothetical protein HYR60_20900 [Acidobacteria bacterium]|nr:hypothetical protein [Acidobacteriota bacterium]
MQGLADSGDVRITASGPGYASGSAAVSLAPSGFYLSGAGPFGDFSTTPLDTEVSVFVGPDTLDRGTLALRFSQSLLRAGVAPVQITLASSNPSVGVTVPSSVVLNPGQRSVSATFRGLTPGVTELSFPVPAGFSMPAGARPVKVTVNAPALILRDVTVGKDLQTAIPVETNAPAPAGGLALTVTSSDPSKLVLSAAADRRGSAQATVTVEAKSRTIPPIFAQALAASGSVRITISGPGFAPASGQAVLTPSAVIIATPAIRTTLLAEPTRVPIATAALDPASGAPLLPQDLRAGLAALKISIASSSPEVGGVAEAVNVGPSSSSSFALFRPAKAGVTDLSVEQPAGFTAPSVRGRVRASVTVQRLSLTNVIVGKGFQAVAEVNLPSTAPAGHPVTVTSSDPSRVLLSASATGAGSASVTLSRDSSTVRFLVQSLSDEGLVQLTATSPGFAEASSLATLTPSGFVFRWLRDAGDQSPVTIDALAPPVNVEVMATPLSPGSLAPVPGVAQSLRPSLPAVALNVTSSSPAVGEIAGSPLLFGPGDAVKAVQMHPRSPGSARLLLETPAGFSMPPTGRELAITVTRPGFRFLPVLVGKDLQSPVDVTLSGAAPASTVRITFTSSDPDKLLLSLSETEVGSTRLTLVARPGSPALPRFYAQALSGEGAVSIRVSADGFTDALVPVQLAPLTLVLFSQFGPGGITTNLVSGVSRLTVTPFAVDSDGNLRVSGQFRPGATPVPVEVTSSDPSIAQVVNSPVVFRPGDSVGGVDVRPVAPGSATLSLILPDGFVALRGGGQQVTITVLAVNLSATVPAAVGKDLQAQVAIGFPVSPLAPVNVTLTSSDPSRLLVSSAEGTQGSQSATGWGYFYVQALSDRGAVTVTASAPGYQPVDAVVNLSPSGFALNPPFGVTAPITLPARSDGREFELWTVALNPSTLAVVSRQPLRAGHPGVRVGLASSDSRVGVLVDFRVAGMPLPSLQFSGGQGYARAFFLGLMPGTAIVSATQPPGFLPPADATGQLAFIVRQPGIRVIFDSGNNYTTLGKDLQTQFRVYLEGTAPAGVLTATVTSSDPSRVLVSTDPKSQGSASLTVPLSQLSSLYAQALSSSGMLKVNVSLAQFDPGSGDVFLRPSAIVFASASQNVLSVGAVANMYVAPALLDPASGYAFYAPTTTLRAGLSPVTIDVRNSDPSVGTVLQPPVFRPGDYQAMFSFKALAPGHTILTIKPPIGFSDVANNTYDIVVR